MSASVNNAVRVKIGPYTIVVDSPLLYTILWHSAAQGVPCGYVVFKHTQETLILEDKFAREKLESVLSPMQVRS